MERILLNAGGGTNPPIPPEYEGWRQVTLDIDPDSKADIIWDIRDLKKLGDTQYDRYDAIYCSHCLEHVYQFEVHQVLAGFWLMLKPKGIVHIVVPDIINMLKDMLSRGLELNDTYYRVNGGSIPITFHDVLYGWNHAMKTGNLFYAHKCAFTMVTLSDFLHSAGFQNIQYTTDGYNLTFKAESPKLTIPFSHKYTSK